MVTPSRLLLFCVILWWTNAVEGKRRLSPLDICEEYLRCSTEKSLLLEDCQPAPIKLQKVNKPSNASLCYLELQSEWDNLEREVESNRQRHTQCVREGARAMEGRLSRQKTKFCWPFMTSLSIDSSDCQKSSLRIDNRCAALRQCCDPAARCEQESQHSPSGRAIAGLHEELDIRHAECLQRREMKGESENDSGKKDVQSAIPTPKTSTQPPLPPFSLCIRYLNCQKDLVNLRTQCAIMEGVAKTGPEYSWSSIYASLPSALDARHAYCHSLHSHSISLLFEKRKRAQQYLDRCVPKADVVMEVREKQRPCQPELLVELPSFKDSLQPATCRSRVILQRNQCELLRDCCIQADVCERNAMYGVLSDDFLLSHTQLQSDMNNCYHHN